MKDRKFHCSPNSTVTHIMFRLGIWSFKYVNALSVEWRKYPVIESKLILLATRQANKLRNKLWRQGIATLFGMSADEKDGRLVSQRTNFLSES